jgi:CRP-like cAMP-binding protein
MRITGEPPLFWTESTHNTEATEDSELLCISKHNFLKLITENATISIKIIQILSQCLHYKAVMAAEISTQDSEHRLLLLFDCIS